MGAIESEVFSLSLDFYQKDLFTPESDIWLDMRIANETESVQRFLLGDDKVYNLEFMVKDEFALALEPSLRYLASFSQNRSNYYREIVLSPRDVYIFRINLKDYVDIESAGIYTVDATFFPELVSKSNLINQNDNTVTISSREPLILTLFPQDQESLLADSAAVDFNRREVLQRLRLTPDEVIEYTLNAKQKRNWDQYFLYQDLETLLQQNIELRREYRGSSALAQNSIIERYQLELEEVIREDSREYIPIDYTILKTTFTQTEATVIVSSRFKFLQYIENRRYTYDLSKVNDIWMISNINVEIEGAQPLSTEISRVP